MRFHTGEAQRAEGVNGLIPGYVGRYVCCSAQALGAGVGLASARLAEQRAPGPREAHDGMVLSWEESLSSAFTSTTRRSGQSATNSCWRRQGERFRYAQGYGFRRVISTWSLKPLGNTPHPRDCREFWSNRQFPLSGTELRSSSFTTPLPHVFFKFLRETCTCPFHTCICIVHIL